MNTQKQMLQRLNPDAILNVERRDWHERYGFFQGKEITQGDSWTHVDSYPFYQSQITLFRVIRLPEIIEKNGKEQVKIQYEYNTNIDHLNTDKRDVLKELVSKNQELLNIPTDIHMQGMGYRVIDPQTMTIKSEYYKRRTTHPVVLPEKKKTVLSVTEEREYLYMPIN